MNNYVKKIRKLLSSEYKGTVATSEDNLSQIELSLGATNEEFNDCQTSLNHKIPQDYIEFLKFSNGAILFNVDDLAGYEFLGTQMLTKTDFFQRAQFEEDWDENIILFCRLIGVAEYLGFKNHSDGQYEILYCSMDETPKNWSSIGESFEEFVSTLIDEKGREFWFDELYPQGQ